MINNRKTIAALFAILAAISLAFTAAPAFAKKKPSAVKTDPAAAQLRFKFTKGDIYNYAATANIDGSMSMSNPSGGNDIAVPLTASTFIELELSVDSVDKEDAASMSININSMRMKIGKNEIINTENGGELPGEVQSLIDSKIKLKMTPRGQVVGITGFKSLGNNPMEQFLDFREMLDNTMVALPEKPIKPGDKWRETTETEIPAGSGKQKLKLDIDLEFTGYEIYKDMNCAVISLSYTGDISKILEGMTMPMGGKLIINLAQQKLTGKIYFSHEYGVLAGLKTNLEQRIDGNLADSGSGKPSFFKMDMDVDLSMELQ